MSTQRHVGEGVTSRAAVRDTLARADGVEVLGPSVGSGYREPPFLVRRADGQVLQLTPLLHAVLDAIDGERDVAGVAAAAGATSGRDLRPEHVRQLVDEHLLPLGLLRLADGSQPAVRKAAPLLG